MNEYPDLSLFLQNLWLRENAIGLEAIEGKGGYSNGKYYPYKTPNGNIDVGPGFDMDKQTSEFRERAAKGFTKEELDNMVLSIARNELPYFRKRIIREGGNPDKVTDAVYNGLLDMYWQLKNGLYGYDKFWRAVASGDYEGMRNESATYYLPKNGNIPKDAIVKDGKILDTGRWDFRKSNYFKDPEILSNTVNDAVVQTSPIMEPTFDESMYVERPNVIRDYKPVVFPSNTRIDVRRGMQNKIDFNNFMDSIRIQNNLQTYNFPIQFNKDETTKNSQYDKGGSLKFPQWDNLSVKEKADVMKVAISNGITNLNDIKQQYNEFAEGGPTRKEIEDLFWQNRMDEAQAALNQVPKKAPIPIIDRELPELTVYPQRNYPDPYSIPQGEITPVTGNALTRAVNNYTGELKYDLANNRVPSGKYTLPAAVLGATGVAGLAKAGEMAYAAGATPLIMEGMNVPFAANGLDNLAHGNADWQTALEIAPLGHYVMPIAKRIFPRLAPKIVDKYAAIKEAYNRNPEISKVGSIDDYNDYLKTVFPESKIQDIQYHMGPKGIEELKGSTGEIWNTNPKAKGIYVSPTKEYPELIRKHTTDRIEKPSALKYLWRNLTGNWDKANAKYTEMYPVLINTKNPLYTSGNWTWGMNQNKYDEVFSNYDGIVNSGTKWYQKAYKMPETIVPSSDQTLILGSNRDLQGFKQFMSKRTSASTITPEDAVNGIPENTLVTTPQITAENAASITPEQWTAAQDAAIAKGDMVEAQRLRDLHFKVNTPDNKVIDVNGNPLHTYHTTPSYFNSFQHNMSKSGRGFYFKGWKDSKLLNKLFGTHDMDVYLNIVDPFIIDKKTNLPLATIRNSKYFDKYISPHNDGVIGFSNPRVVDKGQITKNGFITKDGRRNGLDGIEIVPLEGEQIKSANAVTYDDNGVRIPLGERDNFNINDIRYALLPALGVGTASSLLNLNNLEPSEQTPHMQALGGNLFADGGIHIKPSHRGRLTELKARTGKTEAELYNDGNPAHKKMVVFARNARKWHDLGGNLFDIGGPQNPPVRTTGGAGYVPPVDFSSVTEDITNIYKYLKNYFSNKLSEKDRSAFIDLSNKNVSRIKKDTKGVETILTNEFVEDNDNTIKTKKQFKNTTDTLLGDRKIPLSKISTFYGIEDGKLKAGSLDDFKDETVVIPNRAKNIGKVVKIIAPLNDERKKSYKIFRDSVSSSIDTYNKERGYKPDFLTKLGYLVAFEKPSPFSTLHDNTDPKEYRHVTDSISNIYRPILDKTQLKVINEKGDTISGYSLNATPKALFANEQGNAVFVSDLHDNERQLNDWLKENPSYPIMVDNGRYGNFMLSGPNIGEYIGFGNPDKAFVLGTTKKSLGGNLYAPGGPAKTLNPSVLRAMKYFMDRGFTDYQAAGFVGNLMRESSMDPNALNKWSNAFGLAQWLGDRRNALFAMYGPKPTFEQQLDFIWHELNTTHKNGLKYILASKDAEEAARNTMGYYEFSAGPEGAIAAMNKHKQNGQASMDRGIEFAKQFYGYYNPMSLDQQKPQDPVLAAKPMFNVNSMDNTYVEKPRYYDIPMSTPVNEQYSPEVLAREQAKDNLNTLATVLGILDTHSKSPVNILKYLAI